MSRTLSLVVPSGQLTLGNLLGAIRQWVGDQRGRSSLYGIADLHALTTEHDPRAVRAGTLEQFALLIAAGLDPARCTMFIQSHVPAHAELHWLLEATAHDGELRRMIQYKEKAAGRDVVRSALLAYPVLMAADILLYDVAAVPVGEDQRQHLELARTLAARFNVSFGSTFTVPQATVPDVGARIMDLQNPTTKMSKSAPPASTGVVRLLDRPDVIRRKIARARTDSRNEVVYDPRDRPGVSNLLSITAACTGRSPATLTASIDSYGELKAICTEAVLAVLVPLQESYVRVIGDQGQLDRHLRDGAAVARELAAPALERAKRAIGLLSPGFYTTSAAGVTSADVRTTALDEPRRIERSR